jgi:glycosyltransferase involved in cell wall biosynthesis
MASMPARSRPRPPAATFTVLFVGRLVERKGRRLCCARSASSRAKTKTLGLIIVGDGPERAALAGLAAASPASGAHRAAGPARA